MPLHYVTRTSGTDPALQREANKFLIDFSKTQKCEHNSLHTRWWVNTHTHTRLLVSVLGKSP